MTRFHPNLSTLPRPQRELWPALRCVPDHFVLYGGTGVALRLGHRRSLDFDFFSAQEFHPEVLQRELALASDAEVLQKSSNTLTVRTASEVRVSFFGGLTFGQVDAPDRCEDNNVWVASLRDLLATKLNTVYQRAESKDYVDIDAMLQTGVPLALGLGCAQAVYRKAFNPMLPLKALTFFGDGDLPTLAAEVKQRLVHAVSEVGEIELVTVHSERIAAGEP